MLEVLKPVCRQIDETYDALRRSLGLVSDEQLGWTPGDNAPTPAQIGQHIARANVYYAVMIGPQDWRRGWDVVPVLPREVLLARIEESHQIAIETVDEVTERNLHDSRAESWHPNCPDQTIHGPLEVQWFSLQMARNTAHHPGQMNLHSWLIGVGE